MKLPTWTPSVRPKRVMVTLHGDVETFAPISLACRMSGQSLREHRTMRGLGLRDAAQLLGLGAVELGECERGVRGFDLAQALFLLDQRKTG